MNKKIIDIHTHILYCIDDGAKSREMSLEMIGMEYEQGVRGIFLTNHSYGMEKRYRDYPRRLEELRAIVKEKYPDLALYGGCEVEGDPYDMDFVIRNIRENIFPSMNGTNYVLMEFDPYADDRMKEMTYCLDCTLNAGYIPIIAHAERYARLYRDPAADIARLKEKGCFVQINLYSVAEDKEDRYELANLFLEKQLVDFVGSDSHGTGYKRPKAACGAAAIRERYGDVYADRVLWQNAEALLCI